MKLWMAVLVLCLMAQTTFAQSDSPKMKNAQGLKALLAQSPPPVKISLRYWDIDDDDLKLLADQTQLAHITLGSGPSGKPSRITDKGLAHLAKLKNLRAVNLFFMDVNGTGFKDWQSKRIGRLWAVATNIEDEGVPYIGSWTELDVLAMHGKTLSDDSMKHLAKLHKLRHLRLNSTKLTDAGLLHLKGLKSLQSVFLYKSNVTVSGAAEFRKALPKCSVVRK